MILGIISDSVLSNFIKRESLLQGLNLFVMSSNAYVKVIDKGNWPPNIHMLKPSHLKPLTLHSHTSLYA
uniref:Uncharacterized protein n=1 Tax=Arion vulgaris TaxID=1028688 RepID=A0A0B6Y8V5_9EUPU